MLDNLVVSVALPTIHRELGASIQSLEWTVNAYVLAYAVLLLTGAALGDRFGRKRMFVIGLAIFTAASAAAALAPNTDLLVAARAVQGAGAAIVTPLTLTLLAAAFPAERRGMAIGVWSGISGIAVAIGPLVGGAVVQGISWHWIFWINVPIGIVLIPLAARRLTESRGPYGTLDLPGLGLVLPGAFGLVFGLVRAQSLGWTSATVLVSMIGGVLLLAGFVVRELRTSEPMLPMSFFAKRSFAVTNVASFSMYFGMFGSIFFLSQYMQNVLGNTPLQAGLKLLVWTGATMVVAPLAGVFSERFGSRPFMFAGPDAAGGRAGVVRADGLHPPALLADDRPVRDGRRRHGARVRALRQRRARLRAHRAGRPGLRRQQRDPRGRRGARGRGARLGVHRRGRLRLAAGVRQRPDPGAVGGRRGARRGRADRAGASVPHAGSADAADAATAAAAGEGSIAAERRRRALVGEAA